MSNDWDEKPEKTQESASVGYEYNTLMSALQVSVSKHLLNESFTMVWANDFYYKIIRYPQAEYEAKFHNDPQLYYSFHGYSDELAKVSAAVVRAVENDQSGYSIVTRMPVKGGGHVWVRMTGTFTAEVIDGFPVSYTVITDINDLVQMQKDQSITYNGIPGFVARVLIQEDFSFELLEANDQFQEFFGVKLPVPADNDMLKMNVEMNYSAILTQQENVMQGKPVRFLARLCNRVGKIAWMQVNGDCVDWVGGRPVYLLIYIDVTDVVDLRKMQKQLEAQAQQLRDALQAAERANRAKSDFLSRMSHDIRTPMNAIVGMTEIAAANLDNQDKIRDCLKKIAVSSQHLLGLINDVLDMSKIESGEMALRNDTMFLPTVLENVVAIIQPMIKRRKQQLLTRIQPLAHEQFYCDELRLKQVFINILSNASKFTPEGGKIILEVREDAGATEEMANITFLFSDNGIGIKPEFQDHIFDAFAREKDGRVDKTEGSGLGMAITKKIVDLMGGSIKVLSKWQKGTTFVVEVPLQIDTAPVESMQLPPWRVLVIDDDAMMCTYTVQMLKECGVDARWLDNGPDAVAEVKRAHETGEDYDAVILDWKMPGEDGVETAEKIRKVGKPEIPILICSAYDWAEIEEAAQAAGVNGFLPKPLFRSTLCQGLRRYVLSEDAFNQRSSVSHYDFTGNNILLAEDNELNQEIAIELLAATGAHLEAACNGQECVEMFERSPIGNYDLILMDIQMPVMNGYEAAQIIRALPRADAASVPILALTADAFVEDARAAEQAGMNGHLAKPLNVENMKQKISHFLRAK